jgi:transcription initiation factor TFIIIB Brf1 subunit/transcription initiation factor TFIIB
MARRIDTKTGMKLPKSDSKRTWRRWKDASSSRERNNLRFLKRLRIFAKKFGLSKEQADEFSYTG